MLFDLSVCGDVAFVMRSVPVERGGFMTKSGAKVCIIFFAVFTVIAIVVTVIRYPRQDDSEEKQIQEVEAYVTNMDSYRKETAGGKNKQTAPIYNRITMEYAGERYQIETRADSGFATECKYAQEMHATATAYLCEGKLYESADAVYRKPETANRYYASLVMSVICFTLTAVFVGVYVDKRKCEKNEQFEG